MKALLREIWKLEDSEIENQVSTQIEEFKELGQKSSKQLFKEVCFCILTANFDAERSIKIHNEIGAGFLTLSEPELARRLKSLGHRFPNTRANYIGESKKYKNSLKDIIASFNGGEELREWLVENIKGLGYKEASHFLRNIGYDNFAIVDFHIIDLLEKYNLIVAPSTLTKKRYLKIEDILREIAKMSGLTPAELDLYLWYIETGKILK